MFTCLRRSSCLFLSMFHRHAYDKVKGHWVMRLIRYELNQVSQVTGIAYCWLPHLLRAICTKQFTSVAEIPIKFPNKFSVHSNPIDCRTVRSADHETMLMSISFATHTSPHSVGHLQKTPVERDSLFMIPHNAFHWDVYLTASSHLDANICRHETTLYF